MLFPELERTRMEAMRRGESLFDFYNECGRPGYDTFRSFVNNCIALMPPLGRDEFLSRMRKGGDRQFESALVELLVFRCLHQFGHSVAVHPKVSGSIKAPDFAITAHDD